MGGNSVSEIVLYLTGLSSDNGHVGPVMDNELERTENDADVLLWR
jgi:hypothetical protein